MFLIVGWAFPSLINVSRNQQVKSEDHNITDKEIKQKHINGLTCRVRDNDMESLFICKP